MSSKWIFTIILVLYSMNLKAQDIIDSLTNCNEVVPVILVDNNHEYKSEYKKSAYWRKYKIEKAAAWTVLSVGTAGAACSFFCTTANALLWNKEAAGAWLAVFYTSVGLQLSSIPLFIFAHKNKKMALRPNLTLNTINTISLDCKTMAQPALSLQINF